MQDIDAAVAPQFVGEPDAVGAAPAVDENRDVGSQVALVVEHITAEPRVTPESVFERRAQGRRVARHIGGIDEATQVRREDDLGHAGMMTRNRSQDHPMLAQSTTILRVDTPGRALIDITGRVGAWVVGQGLRDGLLTLFVRHTSASLLIQENADPDVRGDLERFFARLVRDGDPLFEHRSEGPDDMPAHVRAALTATQLSIPLVDGRLALGVWQAIYLYEHRIVGHRREVVLHLLGD